MAQLVVMQQVVAPRTVAPGKLFSSKEAKYQELYPGADMPQNEHAWLCVPSTPSYIPWGMGVTPVPAVEFIQLIYSGQCNYSSLHNKALLPGDCVSPTTCNMLIELVSLSDKHRRAKFGGTIFGLIRKFFARIKKL